jgi:MSHA biogenesis protein MshM
MLYVDRRLTTAGYTKGSHLFDSGAIALLVKASRGIPRLVNVLCHKALMLSYGQGQKEVSRKHVKGAIADTDDATTSFSVDMRMISILTLGLIGTTSVVAWWLLTGAPS